MATFSRRFGNAAGTVLDAQATAVSGITSIEVTGVVLSITATEPKRTAIILLTIDSENFQLDLEFTDEAFNSHGIRGQILSGPAPL